MQSETLDYFLRIMPDVVKLAHDAPAPLTEHEGAIVVLRAAATLVATQQSHSEAAAVLREIARVFDEAPRGT